MPRFLAVTQYVTLYILLAACCVNVDCSVVPEQTVYFVFENTAGENLLENGSLLEAEVTLSNKSTGENIVGYRYRNSLTFSFFGDAFSYELTAKGKLFELVVKVGPETNPDSCCTGYELKSVAIDGVAIGTPNNTITLIL
jgi:hypothetical protein